MMDNNQAQVVLIKDINPGSENIALYGDFVEFNDLLYFAVNDGENGRELWATDGTSNGTQLVTNIVPGSAGAYVANLTESNGKLYFSANDGENGNELWISDGTSSGTRLVADINPGFNDYNYGFIDSSDPDNFTEFNGKLYFAATGGETGEELWVSDGTSDGTQLVADINPGNSTISYFNGSSPEDLTVFNSKLYFNAIDGGNINGLWVSDGTTAGTQLVANIAISDLTVFDNKLYFRANDGETGSELWVSDGTTAGTQLVADINPGISNYGNVNGSDIRDFTEFNGKLYFTADNGEAGRELWVSDGTTAGTRLVADINPGSNGSYPNNLTVFDNKLYFQASDGETGSELWISDGTTEGTRLVEDINPGSNSSYPRNLTVFNGELYFTAVNNETGGELWVTDGTAEGTQLIADFNPGASGSYPNNLTVFDNELYFTADDGEIGTELYKLTFDGSVDPEETIIEGTLGADTIEGTDSGERIKGFAGNDVIKAFGGDDTIFGDVGNDELDGGSGNDTVVGSVGDDTISGGAGNDVLVGEQGNDLFVLSSGEGTDTVTDFDPEQDSFSLSGLSFDQLTLTGNQIEVGDSVIAIVEGVDTSTLSAENFNEDEPTPEETLIEGTLGADTIEGTDSAERIKGFAGDDVINGNGADDTIFGDVGNDELDGGSGNDTVVGSVGNDTISGGTGNDVLVGEEGNDFFVLSLGEGTDTIADFNLGQDRFILGGSLVFEDLSFSDNSILAGDETLATIEGVDTTQLQADNFV